MNGEAEVVLEKKSIRASGLRWLVLTLGCFFLMGSYFCYDIPAICFNTFKGSPYDLSDF
jgi:hypothetical protein